MAPEKATNTSAAAVPMLRLTGWKSSTGRPASKSPENNAMMHNTTTMATAPVDDGNLNFLDGLDAREVDDQNEHEKNHSNRIGVDVVDAEVLRDHGHVGCKPDQRESGLPA